MRQSFNGAVPRRSQQMTDLSTGGTSQNGIAASVTLWTPFSTPQT